MNKIKEIIENGKENILKRKNVLFVILIVLLTIMLPCFQKNLVVGDDYEFHLGRITSLANALKNGDFPVKVHPLLAQEHGYAAGMFYPNMFLYIPAMLCVLGLDVVVSFKIFVFISMLTLILITYVSIKNITDETNSALIGTILIVLSKVVCINLYMRFAIGEYLGLIFFIPIVSGMYDFFYKDFKKPYLLFIGFSGVMNSHIITTLLAITYCVLYFILNIKHLKFKKLLKLFVVALVAVLATASFWMPMLEQFSVQKYNLSNEWVHIESEEYNLYDLFSNQKFSIGMAITLMLPMLIYALFDKRISKKAKSFVGIFFIVVLLTVSSKFWELTQEVTGIIQFKWRLLGILTVIASIAITLVVKEYVQIKELKLDSVMLFILVVSVFITLQFNIFDFKAAARMRSAEDLEKIHYANSSIGIGGEYLPIEVDYSKLKRENQGTSSTGEEVQVIKRNLQSEFVASSEYEFVEIPYIYYYGYVGNIVDLNGNIINLDIEKSENGLIKVMTNGVEGQVSVWYHGTRIQKISYIITIATNLLVIGYVICKSFIIRKNKNHI